MSNKNTPEAVVEHEEYLEDGQVFLYSRNGIFYARVYKGEGTRKYIHRTLKTKNLPEARKRAMKFFYEIQFRKEEDLPLQQKSFNDVIDEYVKLRQTQYERAQLDKINTSRQEQTSIHMLRQIKRVVKFWREYCGKKAVDKIDNAMLQDYVAWRKDWDIARNMGTSVQNIELYYGRSATPTAKATVLGGLPQTSSTALRSTPGRKSI